MTATYKWLIAASIIIATMFRAHYYGYDHGVWSWIIVVTFVIPLVFRLRDLLLASSLVYVMFHTSFYYLDAVPYVKGFVQTVMVLWSSLFVFFMEHKYSTHGKTFKPGKVSCDDAL